MGSLREILSGRGAALFGGRWNWQGRAIAYTSDSPALAFAELLANAGPDALRSGEYVLVRIDFRPDILSTPPVAHIPGAWSAHPPSDATRGYGEQWAAQEASLALRVPTARVCGRPTDLVETNAVPLGYNYLFNPGHRDFSRALDAGIIGVCQRFAIKW